MKAALPAVYRNAKRALAEVMRLDAVKDATKRNLAQLDLFRSPREISQ